MVSTFCPAKQTVLRLNVARSSSRVRKLCTGWDGAVYSLGALRRGLPVRRLRDTLALATGENRSASVEARSWSSNSVGAKAWRMCYSRQYASVHSRACARASRGAVQ
jgi:hypothetical protein